MDKVQLRELLLDLDCMTALRHTLRHPAVAALVRLCRACAQENAGEETLTGAYCQVYDAWLAAAAPCPWVVRYCAPVRLCLCAVRGCDCDARLRPAGVRGAHMWGCGCAQLRLCECATAAALAARVCSYVSYAQRGFA